MFFPFIFVIYMRLANDTRPRQNNSVYAKRRSNFVNDTSRQSAKQSTNAQKPAWYLPEQAAAFVLALGIFATIGPFGTYAMPYLPRLAYWALALSAGWLSVSLCLSILRRLPPLSTATPLMRLGLAIVLATLPTAIAVFWVEAMLRPGEVAPSIWVLLFDVAVICAVVAGAVYLHHLASGGEIAPEAEIATGSIQSDAVLPDAIPPDMTPNNAFYDRLPARLGTALISVSSQDHYVEVVTDQGRTLIHMRMADVLDGLHSGAGQQIHRSHWVAARAFCGLSRQDGRMVARLSDGRALPVSRSFAAASRAMTPIGPVSR